VTETTIDRDVPVADVEATLASLTLQVDRANMKKNAEYTDKKVDEALIRYHGRQAAGGGTEMGGRIQLSDHTAAGAARMMLGESFMPVSVSLGSGEDVNDGTVSRAIERLLDGVPVVESNGNAFNASASQERLFRAMQSADQKATMDPHGTAISGMLTNYIVGKGVRIGCNHSSKIDVILKNFWKRNTMDRRIKNAVKRRVITGEHYFFNFVDPVTADITVRDSVKPWAIRQIECHTDDAETRLSYGRMKDMEMQTGECDRFYADVNYYEQRKGHWGEKSKHHSELEPNVLLQMTRYGGLSDVRGVTPLYPVLRYLKYYEDFLTDRIILNHERSKVVWVKVVKGSAAGESSRTDIGPQGGQTLTETPWLEWKTVSANINASDAQEDGRIIRLAISAGVGMPEHILFQDASQAVYSSIRNHDTPFAQTIRAHQDEWKWDLQVQARMILREKMLLGKLPSESKQLVVTLEAWNHMRTELSSMIEGGAKASAIRNSLKAHMEEAAPHTRLVDTPDIDVDITFPDPVQEDPLKQAQRAEVLHRIHVASSPEIAGWVGLDWWEQDVLQKKAGGWPVVAAPAGKATDSKPGDVTTTDPDEG